MTLHYENQAGIVPAILTPETHQAVWFLGALIHIRAGADATGGRLAVVEHQAERGLASPVHRHRVDDETFLVLEGELRVEVGGQAQAAGAGAVAFLPRGLPHAFVVTSPQARYLTIHTPAGFDQFAIAAGTSVGPNGTAPVDELPLDPAALTALAAEYGIEILGPPRSMTGRNPSISDI
jgi:quercetin dioxygenase-like cupin family protein